MLILSYTVHHRGTAYFNLIDDQV